MNFIEVPGEVFKSEILRKALVRREPFDPKNKEHLKSYKSFLNGGNWGDVQFYCEFPYVTVPETVSRKFANHSLSELLS